jgi:hypothetical protein
VKAAPVVREEVIFLKENKKSISPTYPIRGTAKGNFSFPLPVEEMEILKTIVFRNFQS